MTTGQGTNLYSESKILNTSTDAREINIKQLFSGSSSKIHRSTDSNFMTNESYADKLENYLKEQERSIRNKSQSFEKSRLVVPAIKTIVDEKPDYSPAKPRYAAFQIYQEKLIEEYDPERTSFKQRSMNISQSQESLKRQSVERSRLSEKSFKRENEPTRSRKVSQSNLKKPKSAGNTKRTSKSAKKVTFVDQKSKRETSVKIIKTVENPER